jgi:hypothetical protein
MSTFGLALIKSSRCGKTRGLPFAVAMPLPFGFVPVSVLIGPPTLTTEVDREWGGPFDAAGLILKYAAEASRGTRPGYSRCSWRCRETSSWKSGGLLWTLNTAVE